MPIDMSILRKERLRRGLTLQKVASRLGVSAAQVQRLETGERRMTIAMLEAYCKVLKISPLHLFSAEVRVPIIGVIDASSNIQPVPAGTPNTTRAPHLIHDPARLAAVRWGSRGRFELISGFLMFFFADVEGISPAAWGRRALIRRSDGTQRTGWPVKKDGQVHVLDTTGDVELNIQIEWASPVLAVVAPEVLADKPDPSWV